MKNQYLKEASRYIENARELLSEKAQKEGNYYNDRKYVKLAGHAAYSGILVALDGLLGSKKKGRKKVEWYQHEIGAIDRKALVAFNSAYDTLHLAMGYDGNPSVLVAKSGLQDAQSILEWINKKTTN